MRLPWNDIERRRRKACKRLGENALRACYAQPLPPVNTTLGDSVIMALDFETTGLDARVDHILSIGLVAIEKMGIHLHTAWHQLVQPPGQIPPASAVIHRITDDQAAANGLPLDKVLPQLLQRLSGHVLLVHHAPIEQGFLDRACQALYGADFIAPVIDTEALARRRFAQTGHAYQPRDLRLFNLRQRYGLPAYRAHNALSDALATAELFLAMAAERGRTGSLKLADVLCN